MSFGLYIVTKGELEEVSRSGELLSLNDLVQLGNEKEAIEKEFKRMGFEPQDIIPDEKLFYIENTNFHSPFQVFNTAAGEVINAYVKEGTIYEVIIENYLKYSADLFDYLAKYDFPYEIWTIREDLYEPNKIQRSDLSVLSETTLKQIIDDNTGSPPAVKRVNMKPRDSF
ncbi:hypothetical protein IGI37_002213 [Enterococcus sp. AZ194]|uniref:hypothetical protein n=1 Tax=Enterococcus sp. AZ194 TaxID=2774629 RepID=UPI003F2925EE